MVRLLPISLETFEPVAGVALRREPVLNQVQLGIIEAIRSDPTRYANGIRLVAMQDESMSALICAGASGRSAILA